MKQKDVLRWGRQSTKNILIATALAGMLNVGATLPAAANDPIADFVHVIECIGLLITDEAKHLEVCGTNDIVIKSDADVPATPAPASPGSDCSESEVLIGGICTLPT